VHLAAVSDAEPNATEAGAVDDRELLALTAAGDGEAFTRLVERHQGRLLRLCQRLLGEREEARDAVQEVFLKVYRKAGGFRPQGQVYTWLYRIATNHCLNQLRRRKVVRFLRLEGGRREDGGLAFDPPDSAPGPAESEAARRRWRQTKSAIAALPPGQRAVLVLARFEGLSYKQIAATLGITVGAVESRLFRAMRNLEAAQETDASGFSGEDEAK
jgi:RNA polymerase sigma-70 factor (ECF subfamily)